MPLAHLRVLIVDDEPVARKVLREELEEIEGIDIVGEAENGEQAIERIDALDPELVLLDLHMPGMGGFDVVDRLDGPALPTIVIVTAYDQHAVKAFEAGAIDYLLKPVSEERLVKCIERVRKLRKSSSAVVDNLSKLQEIAQLGPGTRHRKIVGKLGQEYYLLDTSQVLAFQAERELVWILTRKQRYLATQSLRVIQQKLSDLTFARIHRNALVNMDHVAKMAPLSSQRWLLTLTSQQEFVVSKRQARAVQAFLRW